jgi:hypothetical protein
MQQSETIPCILVQEKIFLGNILVVQGFLGNDVSELDCFLLDRKISLNIQSEERTS